MKSREMNRLTFKVNDAYYVNEIRHLYDDTWELVQSLGEYEDIEEELGCSLVVREKALDSFYCPKLENDKKLLNYYVFAFNNEELFIRLIYSQYDDYYNEETTVALKDYGKTWALTREELEND